jgi:hypothetical protein
MSVNVFCESCGESIAADAKFCEHCGATLAAVAAPAGDPDRSRPSSQASAPRTGFDPRQAAERLESLTPGATELAGQLAEQIRTPAVATALVAGGLAAAAVFGIGVLLAVIASDNSLIGLADQGKGTIAAGFAQMLDFLQVGYSNGVGKLGPGLFLVIPIGACAVAAATQARRTRGLPATTRLAAGAAAGLVFGLLMLIPALATGSLGGGAADTQNAPDPNVLSAVLLGVLWGASGGLLGSYYTVRHELRPGFLGRLVPPVVADVGRTIFVAVRPLAVVLALMTATGAVTWTVQTLRKHSLREGNSTLVATIDNAAFAVEHGVHWTELGALVQFRQLGAGSGPESYPVPVNTIKVKTNSTGEYRLFGFNEALPAFEFIPLLIWLIGVPLLLALNAGFAITRVRGATAPLVGAAWGALVGPIWAIAMVLINALVAKDFFGRANGDSVFGMFLIGGLVVGAIGGLLVTQAPKRQAAGASSHQGLDR